MNETYRRWDIEAATEQDAYTMCERRAKDQGFRVLARDHADDLEPSRQGQLGGLRRWDVSLTVTPR